MSKLAQEESEKAQEPSSNPENRLLLFLLLLLLLCFCFCNLVAVAVAFAVTVHNQNSTQPSIFQWEASFALQIPTHMTKYLLYMLLSCQPSNAPGLLEL